MYVAQRWGAKDLWDSDFQSFSLGGHFDALHHTSVIHTLFWNVQFSRLALCLMCIFLHVIALFKIRLDISGAVLALSVKTSSRNAVLAYNAGTANSNDFVAVEVKNNTIGITTITTANSNDFVVVGVKNIIITTLTKPTANTLKAIAVLLYGRLFISFFYGCKNQHQKM